MTTDLTQIDDQELRDELHRREEALKQAKQAEQLQYAATMQRSLTMSVVNTISPRHGRTSCSDDNVGNGWDSADYGPRCTRCALIEAVRGYWPPGFVLDVHITKQP